MTIRFPDSRLAIIALLPDAGHLTPLLHIGSLMQAGGADVVAIVPEEARVLVRSFGIRGDHIGPVLPSSGQRRLRELSTAGAFRRALYLNRRFREAYLNPLQANGLRRLDDLVGRLRLFQPNLLLADTHLFEQDYQQVARELSLPLLLHYSTGSNVRCQEREVWKPIQDKAPAMWWQSLSRLAYSLDDGATMLLDRGEARKRAEARRMVDEVRAGYATHCPRPLTYRKVTTGMGLLEKRYLGKKISVCTDMEQFGPLEPLSSWDGHEALRAWLERSPSSPVLYVAFGTMVSTPKRIIRRIVQTAGDLGVRVLVADSASVVRRHRSWDEERVRIQRWVPQTEVLSHHAVAGFVTHAGSTSIQEALWFATPVLCVPRLWDQFYNAWVAEELGFGLTLDGPDMRGHPVRESLYELLYGAGILTRAQELSREARAQNGDQGVLNVIASLLSG